MRIIGCDIDRSRTHALGEVGIESVSSSAALAEEATMLDCPQALPNIAARAFGMVCYGTPCYGNANEDWRAPSQTAHEVCAIV